MIDLNIKYNVNPPSKTYDVNELENKFFESLFSKINSEGFVLVRMSDGTISVELNTYAVGKIKLQGKKHKMQILKSLYKHDMIEGSIDDFIEHQDEWVKYIRKYITKG